MGLALGCREQGQHYSWACVSVSVRVRVRVSVRVRVRIRGWAWAWAWEATRARKEGQAFALAHTLAASQVHHGQNTLPEVEVRSEIGLG